MPRKKTYLNPLKAEVAQAAKKTQVGQEQVVEKLDKAMGLLATTAEKIPVTTSMLEIIHAQRKALELLGEIKVMLATPDTPITGKEQPTDGADQGNEQAQNDGE